MSITPHPFLDLRPTDRADWVSKFCARRIARPPLGPPFPALVSGQSPSDWLIDQFQRLGGSPGLRDSLRETVVELVATHGGRAARDERDQVVGALLEVARELDFLEIARYLAEWVRSGWMNEGHLYVLGSMEVPLRRTAWSLLIGWDYLDELGPQLARDLETLAMSGESGTAQMCFVALGRRDPAAALEMIPHTVTWNETYWTSSLNRFFSSVGPVALLKDRFKAAWATCLGRCFYDATIERYLRPYRVPQFAEFDPSRPNRLWNVLVDNQIQVKTFSSTVILRNLEGDHLKVDVSDYTDAIEQSTMLEKIPA